MSNIQGINGYGGPHAVSPSGTRDNKAAEAPTQSVGETDQVEISSVGRYLQKIAMLPEIRADKVETVRQALDQGVYDVESRLPQALDRFLEEYFEP